jgi:hypothetical protein
VYKIDYLALHYPQNSSYEIKHVFLNKNYINNKVKEKLNENNKLIQNDINPTYMSVIKPLISWEEIDNYIIKTYTKPKKFLYNKINNTNKRQDKLKEILDNEFSNYEDNLSLDDLKKTIKFIFETYNELIYIRIRNNKIECSYHLYNNHNKVDWFKNLKYKGEHIDKSIIQILEDLYKPYYTVRNPHFQSINNCLLGLDSYTYFEGNPTSYVKEFIEMINYTIKKFKLVPDCDILINRKDFAYLRNDNKYAYDQINNDTISNNINKYWIIGSQSKKKINKDIPIPSADEWLTINNIKNTQKSWSKIWSTKINKAVFRGSSTGCGSTEFNNKRIQLVKETKDNDNFNTGLSKITSRPKVYKSNIFIIDKNKYKNLLGDFLDGEEQMKYKYIINVEGNAQAYRYSTEFSKKSVIINIKSDFYMWFEPLIKNNKHFIETNISNIKNIVNNLKNNDNKAEKIARNGYRFYKKYINKKMISYYWFYFMLNINKITK